MAKENTQLHQNANELMTFGTSASYFNVKLATHQSAFCFPWICAVSGAHICPGLLPISTPNTNGVIIL